MSRPVLSFQQFLSEDSKYGTEDAKRIGKSLSIDWKKTDLDEFTAGLNVESEHDDGSELDVVDSELDLAKIVLAHLKEKPDYYSRLKKVEEDSVPVNSVGANGIAGLTEPIVRKKPKAHRR